MKQKLLIFSIIVYCAISIQLTAQDSESPFFTRSFDTEEEGDVQTGYVTFQNGVKGRAVNLDGYTSFIEVPNRSVCFTAITNAFRSLEGNLSCNSSNA